MRLLESNPEQVNELLQEMAIASGAINKEMAEICWYMRGSIDWYQAWSLTPQQRKAVVRVIKDNIDRVEKTKMPLL